MDEEIKSAIEKNKSGITEQEIIEKLKHHSPDQITNTINNLVSAKQIEKYSTRGVTRYRIILLSQEESEKLVSDLINQSDTSGMTLRDLKSKTNLTQALLTKCLKSLEHKMLIKIVKSHKTNQKLYISFDKQPSEEITGGKWFAEGEVDEGFVNELVKVIYLFVSNKTRQPGLLRICLLPQIGDIHNFISASKITSIFLDENDLKLLLDVMVAEGSLQEIENEGFYYYRAI